MAVDMFLKIEGIKGESHDDKHKDEIQIESFGFGVAQHGGATHGGGMGAGKAQFQDINFTKQIDKASPMLMLHCANGKHIPQALLTVRKAGEKPQEYYKIKLSDIIVSSFNNAGTSHDMPHESLTLHFTKIEFFYAEQKQDGTLGNTSQAGYDLKANKAV